MNIATNRQDLDSALLFLDARNNHKMVIRLRPCVSLENGKPEMAPARANAIRQVMPATYPPTLPALNLKTFGWTKASHFIAKRLRPRCAFICAKDTGRESGYLWTFATIDLKHGNYWSKLPIISFFHLGRFAESLYKTLGYGMASRGNTKARIPSEIEGTRRAKPILIECSHVFIVTY